MTITKVISGGQTGADRGALDAAMHADVPHGGWCPAGRRAEDGAVPSRYCLQSTASRAYEARTEANVRDADATLVFTYGPATGGSKLTIQFCQDYGKPWRHMDLVHLSGTDVRKRIEEWFSASTQLDLLVQTGPSPPDPCVLNVAGQRESEAPGIASAVKRIMIGVLVGECEHVINPLLMNAADADVDRTSLGFD